MAYHCAVNNCSNGKYRLKKWENQLCDSCGCLHGEKECICQPPFSLHVFPTKRYDVKLRQTWKQMIGRKGKNGKLWSPSKDSRVCSNHFVDGKPTPQNPLPTLQLGYSGVEGRLRRMNSIPESTNPKVYIWPEPVCYQPDEVMSTDPDVESLPREIPQVPWIVSFLSVFMVMGLMLKKSRENVQTLEKENQRLKAEVLRLKSKVYTDSILQNDKDVQFFTGLPSLNYFNTLHDVIAPYVRRRWTGFLARPKNIRNFKKIPARFGPERKITSKGEFLLTLMRLRLGLLGKDLAKRFSISESLCSRIFFAWLRATRKVVECMVEVDDQETIIACKPDRFRDLPDLHSIIDCTEIFIETPKDLRLQSATWSDYKHHNTIKVLVACSPHSSVMFVSPAYLGRISDKALTLDCGYLDQVPMYSMIMADKGFNIGNDCAERCISLHVPPGKRGQSQMPKACVAKTKKIANRRILIEQVIRRLKTFRILSQELPLSLVPHADDIVMVCAGFCNIKKPIYKD